MKELYQHLEFSKVKDILVELCHSAGGKELAGELYPFTNREQILARQSITEELQLILKRSIDYDFSKLTPISKLFTHYEHLAFTFEEFTAVYSLAKTAQIIKKEYENDQQDFEDTKHYAERVEKLSFHNEIVGRYDQIFSPEGEVLDTASPELKSIRRRLVNQRQNILDLLQKTLQNRSYENILQDKIITQRENRYVIPLKDGGTSVVPGIVHGSSGSGATVFVEPTETISLNNELHRLRQAEQEEIYRLLCEYTKLIQLYREPVLNDFSLLTELDFLFATARMGNAFQGNIPQINQKLLIKLKDARHPLLIRSLKGVDKVIPFDLTLGENYNLLVLSGPNTGGKTVTLKTVGLLTLMALSGLPVPAKAESEFGIFNQIIADIGDQQSLEDSLSTFSGHLHMMAEMVNRGDSSTLVLIDEIGAATDPEQGVAFAQAILEKLVDQDVKGIVTTHYTPLKVYAQNSEKCLNAAMQFDPNNHIPTFQFKSGIPGNSFALEIAAGLGFSQEVLERAKMLMGKQNVELTELLTGLAEEKRELARSRYSYDLKNRLSEQRAKEYEQKIELLEQEKKEIRQKSLKEAQEFLANLQRDLADEYKQLEKVEKEKKKQLVKNLEKRAAVKIQSIAQEQKKYSLETLSPLTKPVVGERVWVKDIDGYGEIISLEKNGVKVDINGFFLTTGLKNLYRSEQKEQNTPPKAQREVKSGYQTKTAKTELKVIGLTFDDAHPLIESFIDDGFAAGLRMLRIVHGKGTGALRDKIRSYLKGVPIVNDFYSPAPEAGGDGVTVVVIS